MAYSRNTWVCGDVISAQKLNNMENGIEEALECCGGDAGYSCEDGWQEIWSHEFDNLQQVYGHDYYAETASWAIYLPNTIKIEINSEEYVLEGVEYGAYGSRYYGAPISFDQHGVAVPDFSGEYQFSITNNVGEGAIEIKLCVPSDGDYDVAISEESTIITTTECFEKAVNSVVNNVFVVTYDSDSGEIDKTFSEIKTAIEANRTVELHDIWGTNYQVAPLVSCGNQSVTFASMSVNTGNASLGYSEYVIDQSNQCTNTHADYSLNSGE